MLPYVFTQLHSTGYPQPRFDIGVAQNWMIRHALNDVGIQTARGDVPASADICEWKRIDCSDGLTTAIYMYSEKFAGKESIELEWLPPTVQFVHLEHIQIVRELPFKHLPRELKYLYSSLGGHHTPCIDCSLLPHKMEELILQHTTNASEIRFENMPQTMRYVYIRHAPRHLNAIIVNYNTLPASLEELYVTTMKDHKLLKQKVKAIGKPRDVKLQTKYDFRHPTEGSTYFSLLKGRSIS